MKVERFPLEQLPDHLPPGVDPACVLSLSAARPGETHTSGSGVVITPHLVLTARHVVEDYEETIGSQSSTWGIQGASALSPAHQNRAWHFDAALKVGQSDQALLVNASTHPPFVTVRPATLALVPPEPGDEVFAIGFHSGTATPAGSPDTYFVNEQIAVSRGIVTDVYHQSRDRVMAPFPCFHADLEVFGSMSGGPVFNASGDVCGVISLGITGSTHTTVASVWPLLVRQLDHPRLQASYASTVYEAVLRCQIAANGLSRIEPSFGPDGVLRGISLRGP